VCRRPTGVSANPQIFRGHLARTSRPQLVADPRALGQASVAGLLDGTDVHENVRAAFIGLNEAIAFGQVEPLHFANRHGRISESRKLVSRRKAYPNHGSRNVRFRRATRRFPALINEMRRASGPCWPLPIAQRWPQTIISRLSQREA